MMLQLVLVALFLVLVCARTVYAEDSTEQKEGDGSVVIPLKDLKELPVIKSLPVGGLLKTVAAIAMVAVAPKLVQNLVSSEQQKPSEDPQTKNESVANTTEKGKVIEKNDFESSAEENELYKVQKLCAELLDWAEDWMIENPKGCVYCEEARGLLEVLEAENDLSYICCDVYDDRKEGYAITDEGFYFRDSGVFSGTNYFYSFDELSEAKISLEGGYVYVNDQCVNIGLSDLEAKKLYKVLKKISRLFEPEDEED